MEQAVGMVDSGFLVKSLGQRLHKDIGPFDLNPLDVRNWFRHAAARLRRELLRTYWYDAAYPSDSHLRAAQMKEFETLDETPGLQVRLGRLERRPLADKSKLKTAVLDAGGNWPKFCEQFDVKNVRTQKGVDTLIVLDMLRMADSGCRTLLLVSGDADLAAAVQAVQDRGVQVVLAAPQEKGVAPSLRRMVDEFVIIGETQLRRLTKSKDGLQSYIDHPE